MYAAFPLPTPPEGGAQDRRHARFLQYGTARTRGDTRFRKGDSGLRKATGYFAVQAGHRHLSWAPTSVGVGGEKSRAQLTKALDTGPNTQTGRHWPSGGVGGGMLISKPLDTDPNRPWF